MKRLVSLLLYHFNFQVEKLTTQLNMAEQDNAELKSTVKNMERILEIERQDRDATEQKTITLLEDVRRKWSRAEEERMEVVRRELSEEKERAARDKILEVDLERGVAYLHHGAPISIVHRDLKSANGKN